MTQEIKASKKVSKKPVKKDLEGKEILAKNDYQVRELENGTLMLYVKRSQKLLVRLLPAMGNPKAI